MAKKTKRVNLPNVERQTKKAKVIPLTENKPCFRFDKIDKGGKFAFDVRRADFDTVDFLDKMINYSNMTWQEIAKQTHDRRGKSKHHYLPFEKLSREAQQRIEIMQLEDFTDDIFSFAFTNTTRIIGLKLDDDFHVLWYDANHEVYPTKKK